MQLKHRLLLEMSRAVTSHKTFFHFFFCRIDAFSSCVEPIVYTVVRCQRTPASGYDAWSWTVCGLLWYWIRPNINAGSLRDLRNMYKSKGSQSFLCSEPWNSSRDVCLFHYPEGCYILVSLVLDIFGDLPVFRDALLLLPSRNERVFPRRHVTAFCGNNQ